MSYDEIRVHEFTIEQYLMYLGDNCPIAVDSHSSSVDKAEPILSE